MAEIPALPGCRAWGDTSEEAIDIISDLAVGFILDDLTENRLSPQVNVVEPEELREVYFLTPEEPKEYDANWISPNSVELTVSV